MKEVNSKNLPPELRKEYDKTLCLMIKNREQLKQYSGLDASVHINQILAILEDVIHISDPRDFLVHVEESLNIIIWIWIKRRRGSPPSFFLLIIGQSIC